MNVGAGVAVCSVEVVASIAGKTGGRVDAEGAPGEGGRADYTASSVEIKERLALGANRVG